MPPVLSLGTRVECGVRRQNEERDSLPLDVETVDFVLRLIRWERCAVSAGFLWRTALPYGVLVMMGNRVATAPGLTHCHS